MAQEAMTELDMDVFSRRISPYFTWLESKIESGWQQSESVQKDVLKECRYLSTNMRARFILGISREDFAKEVRRTLELLELASEAFPAESEEVETKMQLFCKGVSEELGAQFLPEKYQAGQPAKTVMTAPAETQKTPDTHVAEKPVMKVEKPKPVKKELVVQADEPAPLKEQPKTTPKVQKPVTLKKTPAPKPKMVAKQQRKAIKKAAVKSKKAKRKAKKGFFLVRWVKNFFDRS